MKKLIIILIVIVCLVALSRFAEIDHNDNKCDICRKDAIINLAEEEYCRQHFDDAVDYYLN